MPSSVYSCQSLASHSSRHRGAKCISAEQIRRAKFDAPKEQCAREPEGLRRRSRTFPSNRTHIRIEQFVNGPRFTDRDLEFSTHRSEVNTFGARALRCDDLLVREDPYQRMVSGQLLRRGKHFCFCVYLLRNTEN